MTVWFMKKRKVFLFFLLKENNTGLADFRGEKFPKIILLGTVPYSRNTERHGVFGFKAPNGSSRQLWGWIPDDT